MAITILDLDWNDSVKGGRNPPMSFDFNPSQAGQIGQKRYRQVMGRMKAYDGDTIKAEQIGLRSIRSAIFTPYDSTAKCGGSVKYAGSQNNIVTLDVAQGATTAFATFSFFNFLIAGDI